MSLNFEFDTPFALVMSNLHYTLHAKRSYVKVIKYQRYQPYRIKQEMRYTQNVIGFAALWTLFLQGVSIACYAAPCISYERVVRPSVCLSVCPSVTTCLRVAKLRKPCFRAPNVLAQNRI